jgi:hypothetical protein
MRTVPPPRERRGLENGTKDYRSRTGCGGHRRRRCCSHRPGRARTGGPAGHAVRRPRSRSGPGRLARREHGRKRSCRSAASELGHAHSETGSSGPRAARAAQAAARSVECSAEPARGTAGSGMWRIDVTSSASAAASAATTPTPAATTPTAAATPTTSASSTPAAGRVARNRVAVRSSAAGATRFGRRAVSASTGRQRGCGSRPGPP